MRNVYAYNVEGYFLKIVEQSLDELTKKYPNLINATAIEPPTYNPAIEIPKFVNDAWELEDLKEVGTFYLKTDATEVTEIVKKDAILYTGIKPLQKYDDGTSQTFNDAAKTWEYTFKGADLLEVERIETLKLSKQAKLEQLESHFNLSKKITIQNGNTLIIEHNTPERDVFLEKLMTVLQESSLSNTSISYQQKVNNSMYRFSALPTIWSYIFKDLFLTDRKTSDGTPTGFKENSRERNKIVFDAMVLKIQNSTTTEELNAISWEFANPNGVVIDVNDKATQMLNDVNVDDFTKQAINTLKDSTTGQIHLINIVE